VKTPIAADNCTPIAAEGQGRMLRTVRITDLHHLSAVIGASSAAIGVSKDSRSNNSPS
jgi:hypothetical protein